MKAAAWAASAAVATLGVVAARQLGLVRRLPDPPGEVWDSDAIVMSKTAHPAGIPDGVLGMASYSVSLGLLLLARDTEWVRPLAWAKLALDASAAATNAARQVMVFGKLCSWCMATVICTVAMVELAKAGSCVPADIGGTHPPR